MNISHPKDDAEGTNLPQQVEEASDKGNTERNKLPQQVEEPSEKDSTEGTNLPQQVEEASENKNGKTLEVVCNKDGPVVRNKKGSKAGKATAAPRPPTAYNLFYKEAREELQSRNSEMTMIEVTKAVADKWKKMAKEDKKKYEELALKEKTKLVAQLAAESTGKLPNSLTPDQEEKSSSKKTPKKGQKTEKGKPRQKRMSKPREPKAEVLPASSLRGFTEFCVDNRKRIEDGLGEGATLADIQRELTKEWDQLEEQGKRKYAESEASLHHNLRYPGSPKAFAVSFDDEVTAAISEGIVTGFTKNEEGDTDEIGERTQSGTLDLDDVPAGSMLEVLAFLGNMREDVFPHHSTKLQSPDVWMKVPMLGLCFIVQNLLDGERSSRAQVVEKLRKAEKRIEELEHGGVEKSNGMVIEE
eukprot:TRINITY_DN4715_c0_g1_i8.p1 TRINITY_DN4715_c0_g1~~TRINITY_DN4715_c0_g1_i8.p1  ORF type:complete len:414 (-),score=85.92 TRINITY_DN4715_c0_g1_i8:159-1400(-)